MKHFLKPLGHCLTTAVMTSAMLRVYALPAVEAATPDTAANSQSTASEAAPVPEAPTGLVNPVPVSTQEIAPPERVTPLETSPAGIQPSPQPTDTTSFAAESTASEPSQVAKPPVAAPLIKPDAPAVSGGKPTTVPTPPSSLNSTPAPLPDEGKASPEQLPQKAGAGSNSRTVAGMRQILEKRLAEIVEQDKASRNAQWLQNVTVAALQYAWQGQFEQARQIAANPALPPDVQSDLLGKIIAIEAQRSSQIAQQSNQPAAQANLSQIAQAQPGGRNLPNGYYPTAGNLSGYAEFSLRNQCPAINRSAPVAPVASPMAKSVKSNTQTPSTQSKFPDFLPALGKNLATRLAELNRTETATSSVANSGAKPVQSKNTANSNQPIVSPQLFAGIATSSLQNQIKTSGSEASLPLKTTSTVTAQETTSREQASQDYAQTKSSPIASSQTIPTSTLSAQSLAPQVQAEADVNPSLNQIVGSTFDYSLQQFGISWVELIPEPLNLAWDWWTVPNSEHQTETTLGQSAAGSNPVGQFAMPSPGTIAAETGLSNNPLLQTLEQKLTAPLVFQSFRRDGRKLSIPTLPLKLTTAKASVKAPTYDAATLLAISCANAQLAHYDGSYTIDPATSKRLGWVNLMYPLPIAAVITSAFGWRVHPISGNLSFHTGLDIGAPMGTPVLSAQTGRVVAADYMGGYGLAVVVENEATKQRNLYGHLSGIAVQPGAQVAQGAVLGWVGSTGNSTGPHLHFESLIHTENGWTAVDPIASAAVSIAQGN